jgi:hypothetical protein
LARAYASNCSKERQYWTITDFGSPLCPVKVPEPDVAAGTLAATYGVLVNRTTTVARVFAAFSGFPPLISCR